MEIQRTGSTRHQRHSGRDLSTVRDTASAVRSAGSFDSVPVYDDKAILQDGSFDVHAGALSGAKKETLPEYDGPQEGFACEASVWQQSYVRTVVNGLMKSLDVVATLTLDLEMLIWIKGLRGVLRKRMGEG